MKPYSDYLTEDFCLDDDFIAWVRTGRHHAFWLRFIEEHPEKSAELKQARRILEGMPAMPEMPDDKQVQDEVDRLMQGLHAAASGGRIIRQMRYTYLKLILAGAAAALLAFIAGRFFTADDPVPEHFAVYDAGRQVEEQVNTSSGSVTIHLPDGSHVRLSPHSRIRYAAGMGDSAFRDVYLDGEAFFEVQRNVEKPFRVFAHNTVTKVLGTSFLVRSFDEEEQVSISVRTGKVSVAQNKPGLRIAEVLLGANQQAVYSKQEHTFIRKLADKPTIIKTGIADSQMIFDEVPVVRILELLKEAYGIRIDYNASELSSCTITADLSDESLFRKLDLICAAIDASYAVIDSEVIIQAVGCSDMTRPAR